MREALPARADALIGSMPPLPHDALASLDELVAQSLTIVALHQADDRMAVDALGAAGGTINDSNGLRTSATPGPSPNPTPNEGVQDHAARGHTPPQADASSRSAVTGPPTATSGPGMAGNRFLGPCASHDPVAPSETAVLVHSPRPRARSSEDGRSRRGRRGGQSQHTAGARQHVRTAVRPGVAHCADRRSTLRRVLRPVVRRAPVANLPPQANREHGLANQDNTVDTRRNTRAAFRLRPDIAGLAPGEGLARPADLPASDTRGDVTVATCLAPCRLDDPAVARLCLGDDAAEWPRCGLGRARVGGGQVWRYRTGGGGFCGCADPRLFR